LDGAAHRVVGVEHLGNGCIEVDAATGGHPAGQVVVAAGEARGPQRGEQRELVGRVVDGPQHREQVGDLLGEPHERAGLDAVRDVEAVERGAQLGEAGAGGDQDGDVVPPCGADLAGASVLHRPAAVDDPAEAGGEVV